MNNRHDIGIQQAMAEVANQGEKKSRACRMKRTNKSEGAYSEMPLTHIRVVEQECALTGL